MVHERWVAKCKHTETPGTIPNIKKFILMGMGARLKRVQELSTLFAWLTLHFHIQLPLT